MLTTLFFDLDDTLLDFKGGESIAIRQTLAQAGIAPTDEMAALYSAINQSQWELLEEGKLTRDQVLLRRFDILFARLGIQGDSKKTQAVYENLLAQQHGMNSTNQDAVSIGNLMGKAMQGQTEVLLPWEVTKFSSRGNKKELSVTYVTCVYEE